jgi:hypothetical protein
MSAVIFCLRCGSHNVDVNSWRDRNTAEVHCYSCGNERLLRGFTLGRADIPENLLLQAAGDIALPGALPVASKLALVK